LRGLGSQIFRRYEELTKDPNAPRTRKRPRNADKGISTTSRNKSAAQSGGKRAPRKKKPASEEEEEEPEDYDIEEDQLDEPAAAGPSGAIEPALAAAEGAEEQEGDGPATKRRKRNTLAARALAQPGDISDGPPTDENAAEEYDRKQMELLAAAQTTRCRCLFFDYESGSSLLQPDGERNLCELLLRPTLKRNDIAIQVSIVLVMHYESFGASICPLGGCFGTLS
jgi:hypothetical protein